MCIYYYSFSFFIEEKFFLSFIFKTFFSLLSIVLYIFFTKRDFIFLPSFLMNIITIIAFHFLWIKDLNSIIYISYISFVLNDICLPLSLYMKKYEIPEHPPESIDNDFLLPLFLNYEIFSLIFAIPGLCICLPISGIDYLFGH